MDVLRTALLVGFYLFRAASPSCRPFCFLLSIFLTAVVHTLKEHGADVYGRVLRLYHQSQRQVGWGGVIYPFHLAFLTLA